MTRRRTSQSKKLWESWSTMVQIEWMSCIASTGTRKREAKNILYWASTKDRHFFTNSVKWGSRRGESISSITTLKEKHTSAHHDQYRQSYATWQTVTQITPEERHYLRRGAPHAPKVNGITSWNLELVVERVIYIYVYIYIHISNKTKPH